MHNQFSYKDVILSPDPKVYGPEVRTWQGCPSIAVTPQGRIYIGICSGGKFEPCIMNHGIIQYSDDGGDTWKMHMVVDTNREDCVRALDPQLFMKPDGTLVVGITTCGYIKGTKPADYSDCNAAYQQTTYFLPPFEVFFMECSNPDADEPVFSDPYYAFDGFLRNRPVFVDEHTWYAPAYDWYNYDHYVLQKTTDGGKTFETVKAGKMYHPMLADESVLIDCDFTGSERPCLSLLARSTSGTFPLTTSYDGGRTWTDAKPWMKNVATSRFMFRRLKSGNIVFAKQTVDDPRQRIGISVYLSEDNGKTFPYTLELDPRDKSSYPDIAEYDGKIYVVHDCERGSHDRMNEDHTVSIAAKQILLSCITEDDIRAGCLKTPGSFISKQVCRAGNDVISGDIEAFVAMCKRVFGD